MKLLRLVQVRELLAQFLYLREIVDDDVWLIRVMGQVVLMIAFSFVKRFERSDLSNDGSSEDFSFVQLIDVSLSNALLLFVGIEDSGAILRTGVGPLAV